MYKWNGLEIQAEGEGISPTLSRQINLLGSLLGHAVRIQAGDDIYQQIEYYRKELKHAYQNDSPGERERVLESIAGLSHRELDWLLRSFKAFFHLANKAEQEEITRINRERDAAETPDAPSCRFHSGGCGVPEKSKNSLLRKSSRYWTTSTYSLRSQPTPQRPAVGVFSIYSSGLPNTCGRSTDRISPRLSVSLSSMRPTIRLPCC